MKTKEFIEKVKDLGFSVENDCGLLVIKNNNKRTVMTTEIGEWGNINTNYPEFKSMNDFEGADTRWRLLEVAFEYVFTLIEEREGQKYYLTLPNHINENSAYLNLDVDLGRYTFSKKLNGYGFKTQFTQEEIENLPKQDFIQSLEKELVE